MSPLLLVALAVITGMVLQRSKQPFLQVIGIALLALAGLFLVWQLLTAFTGSRLLHALR
ncbi:MAG: hypothetical protein JO089_09030 [Alphaproteobacteria bacterium]|nr:hypothetical protein [Alphaproteobacteria bacterium]